MSFNIQTPTNRQKRLEAESALALDNQKASFTGTPENMIVKVINLASHELHSHIKYQGQQILPRGASSESIDRHASFWLSTPRKQPTHAQGAVVIEGNTGAVIPEGTTATISNGNIFTFQADATIGVSGTVEGVVKSSLKGDLLNVPAGIALELSAPIVGVSSITVGADGLSGGANIETDESLVTRIEESVQAPAQGGNAADYIGWAKEVAGVTRVWAYPKQFGRGTVGILFVLDDKAGGNIPTALEVEVLEAHLNTVAPVTADIYVSAVTAKVVNLSIAVSPLTNEIKTAVTGEIQAFFKREAEPGKTLFLSRISEAISIATGEFNHVLSAPIADVESAYGELPELGVITWSAA